jgi:hypothetical protein
MSDTKKLGSDEGRLERDQPDVGRGVRLEALPAAR